jgi:hypothetical protein
MTLTKLSKTQHISISKENKGWSNYSTDRESSTENLFYSQVLNKEYYMEILSRLVRRIRRIKMKQFLAK